MTTDLLRRAAELLLATFEPELAASLLALADEMERAGPVAWQERNEGPKGKFSAWYERPQGYSLDLPREIILGGIRYQIRPLFAAPVPDAKCAPSSCGYCSYEESNGELIAQCPTCKAKDRAKDPAPEVTMPEGLHPRTADLVSRFASALAEKLCAAEQKYGYGDGWAEPDWMGECRAALVEHVRKGDPRDVAAYCAFLWHHGERTELPAPEVTRDARCPDCLGSEFTGWKRGIRCARCNGTGEIDAMQEPKP